MLPQAGKRGRLLTSGRAAGTRALEAASLLGVSLSLLMDEEGPSDRAAGPHGTAFRPRTDWLQHLPFSGTEPEPQAASVPGLLAVHTMQPWNCGPPGLLGQSPPPRPPGHFQAQVPVHSGLFPSGCTGPTRFRQLVLSGAAGLCEVLSPELQGHRLSPGDAKEQPE